MKKMIMTIFLMFVPVITLASSATCTYKTGEDFTLTVNYNYGEKLSYKFSSKSSKWKYDEYDGVNGLTNSSIVDKNGNIACPTIYFKTNIVDKNKYNVSYSTTNESNGVAITGSLKILTQDDKEKNNADSGEHICTYNEGTDSEYGLRWKNGKVEVILTGKKYKNYCDYVIQGEFTEEMFKNEKCPSSVYDLASSRYENLTSNCKGRLIISTKSIMTDNDSTTEVDSSQNIYDGSQNDLQKENTEEKKEEEYKPHLNYSQLCQDDGIKSAMKIIGNIIFIIKILVPFVIIVLGMVDFGKAVISSDDKAISKATASLGKRFIAGILVFLTPSIINGFLYVISPQIGNYETGDYYGCVKCVFDPYGDGCN